MSKGIYCFSWFLTLFVFKGILLFLLFQDTSRIQKILPFLLYLDTFGLLDWCWIRSPPNWAPQAQWGIWDVYPMKTVPSWRSTQYGKMLFGIWWMSMRMVVTGDGLGRTGRSDLLLTVKSPTLLRLPATGIALSGAPRPDNAPRRPFTKWQGGGVLDDPSIQWREDKLLWLYKLPPNTPDTTIVVPVTQKWVILPKVPVSKFPKKRLRAAESKNGD